MAVLERLCLHFSAITCRSSDSKGHEPTQGLVHACPHIIFANCNLLVKQSLVANNFSCTVDITYCIYLYIMLLQED